MSVTPRNKAAAARENPKPSAQDDVTYPADMEQQRAEPSGQGEDKPGPKNPDTIAKPEKINR